MSSKVTTLEQYWKEHPEGSIKESIEYLAGQGIVLPANSSVPYIARRNILGSKRPQVFGKKRKPVEVKRPYKKKIQPIAQAIHFCPNCGCHLDIFNLGQALSGKVLAK